VFLAFDLEADRVIVIMIMQFVSEISFDSKLLFPRGSLHVHHNAPTNSIITLSPLKPTLNKVGTHKMKSVFHLVLARPGLFD